MYEINYNIIDTLQNREYWLEPDYNCKLDKNICLKRQKNKDSLSKIYVPASCKQVIVLHIQDRTIIKLMLDGDKSLEEYTIPQKKKLTNYITKKYDLNYRLFSAPERPRYESINLVIRSEKPLKRDFTTKKYLPEINLPSLGGSSIGSTSYVFADVSCADCGSC